MPPLKQVMTKPVFKKALLALIILLLLLAADIMLGSIAMTGSQLIEALFTPTDSIWSSIVWEFRMPKALTCILAGGSLAVGGLLMQTLFRNPLAGPDVLGLTHGSSLLVAIYLLIGQSLFSNYFSLLSGPWSIVLASSLGGVVIFLLVISISQYVKDNTSLLIIGLMLSAATSSIISVLQFTSRAEDLQTFMIWSLGNVGSTNWTEIKVMAVVILVGIFLTLISIKNLNTWLLGENYAQNLGLNLKRSRLIIVAAAGLFTGAVTAFCGPIAFVGLAVPHLVRLLIPTTNHQILIPFCFLIGAALLLFCDLLAQWPGATQALPLNAVTSMIGAPIVIWLVVKYKYVRL